MRIRVIGSEPKSDMVEFVEKKHWGEIIINRQCEANTPRLLSPLDFTNVPEKQIIVAAAEGCKAALSTFRYYTPKVTSTKL
jgi:alkyl hydroperoxide reductase subunit F